MQKHAYLILAHADFEVLRLLIGQLDHQNNDIFIHFDKKVKNQPKITTKSSKLTILEESVDIRWGHISMLRAELYLFETAIARKLNYHYYHLISGTHYPLRSQKNIHSYFSGLYKNVFVRMETSSKEIDLKLGYQNLFIKNFNHKKPLLKRYYQLMWLAGIKVQQWFRIKRIPIVNPTKASQWLSLNENSVSYLIANKSDILKRYRRTLCADEFFIPSTLASAKEDFECTYVDDLLFCEFVGPNPKVFKPSDIPALQSAKHLFARKFNDANIEVIYKLNRTTTAYHE